MINRSNSVIATAGSSSVSSRHHWVLHLAEGVVLILLGGLAAFIPFGLGIAIFGWLFLIGGIAGLITTCAMWTNRRFFWSLLSAVLATSVGIIVFAVPEFAIVGFPLLLMTFLVLEGGATIMLALEHRRELSGRWGWMF